jgi:hypothetical protein
MVDWSKLPDPALAGMSEDFFAKHIDAVAEPIVPRLDSELLDDARNHSDPAVREHAAVELLARHGRASFSILSDLWKKEEDAAVRQSLFEELVTLDKPQFKLVLESMGVPADLQAWGRAHFGIDYTVAIMTATDKLEPFDQIIPLRITLKEYVEVEPNVWKYHVFAPIQETRVAGQLYACSIVETRNKRIALTKQLQGLHADGSLHIENTLFNGRTIMLDKYTGVFSFQTAMPVPFYPSGRIGDQSEGIIPDALVPVMRAGAWILDRNLDIRGIPAIQNVTGLIRAWGYTRPDRATFDPAGRMDQVAGLFHLGSLIDPRTRDYVNTYTIGTYRGVVTPNAEGVIGLNTNPSYMTVDGLIDRNRDGVADRPGEHYDICPSIFPVSHYTQGR